MNALIADIDRLLATRITLAVDERRVLLNARAEIVRLEKRAGPEPLCICGMGIAPCRAHRHHPKG